ncbi:hypothetical protein ACOSP7_020545 [Xanthoceras sorbifolium]
MNWVSCLCVLVSQNNLLVYCLNFIFDSPILGTNRSITALIDNLAHLSNFRFLVGYSVVYPGTLDGSKFKVMISSGGKICRILVQLGMVETINHVLLVTAGNPIRYR